METANGAPEPQSFEQALVDLQQVLRRLEDGETGLEEALACYEKGIGLLKHCYGQLREAEQRILLLTGVDEAGKPVTQPFVHLATAEEKGGTPRRRPRAGSSDIPF